MWPRAAFVLATVLAEQRYDNPERKPCLAEVTHDGEDIGGELLEVGVFLAGM